MISKKFIRNSVIYTIAGSLPLASAIILLPFYIKYLSADVYGALALYMGFALLIQILISYSFDGSIYVYFHDFKNDKAKLNLFVSSIFIFVLIISLVIAIIFLIFGGWIFEQVFPEIKILFFPYGLISVATGIFQGFFKINSSLLQTQEKASSFLWLNLVSFTLIAIFTIGGLYFFPNDLLGPIVGRFVAVAFTGLIVLIGIYRQFGFRFNFGLLKSTLSFNHPSFGYQIIQWFNGYYDKVLMTLYMPIAQIGIYDFASKCLLAIEFALAGLYNSFFPKVLGMVALQTEKKTTIEINRYYNGLTAITILLVGFCIFLFPVVIEWFVTQFDKVGYLASIQWIPFLAVTYLLRSIRFYAVMPYAAIKYQKPLPLFYLLIFGVKLGGMLLLIPNYGIMGVIISTWISYFVEVAVLYFGIRRKFSFKVNIFKTFVAPLLMASLVTVAEPLFGIQNSLLTHGAYIIFGITVLAWGYRNEVKVFQLSKLIK
ncbi:MAG: lipopolysaccharide biosynthesis protein [Bacteroidetes bacterium]|nr:lipopolysaccharide biosynthesis protein [Bacteroidota bacterium]MBI3481936.1 lipopolysaccharide biosynthesis protein [Bacteroidota bacterium]